MKRILIIIITLLMLSISVKATEYIAPTVPEAGEKYMPDDTQSFSEGLWYILKSALEDVQPEIYKAAGICLSVIAVVILICVVYNFHQSAVRVYSVAAVVAIGTLLIRPAGTLITLGVQTVQQINDYAKLLIPVITAALAAQGGVNVSTTLYVGTTLFCTLLTTLISKLLVPMLYIFLCLGVISNVVSEDLLSKLKGFIKWLLTWSLKTILYVFTGFLTVSGVVSGSADASALKAAKLTISGVVPVIGNILSEASEAVLVGAGVMKNSAGIYGLFAILSIWIGPFLKIGIQYMLINFTSAMSSIFGLKETSSLIHDFSDAMGMVLAMTAAVCVMLLVSIVCFMKGVA